MNSLLYIVIYIRASVFVAVVVIVRKNIWVVLVELPDFISTHFITKMIVVIIQPDATIVESWS